MKVTFVLVPATPGFEKVEINSKFGSLQEFSFSVLFYNIFVDCSPDKPDNHVNLKNLVD